MINAKTALKNSDTSHQKQVKKETSELIKELDSLIEDNSKKAEYYCHVNIFELKSESVDKVREELHKNKFKTKVDKYNTLWVYWSEPKIVFNKNIQIGGLCINTSFKKDVVPKYDSMPSYYGGLKMLIAVIGIMICIALHFSIFGIIIAMASIVYMGITLNRLGTQQ